MIVPPKMAGKERLPCPCLCDISSFFPCIEKYVSHINSIRHFLYRKTVHGHQSSASCRLGIGRIYLPEDRPMMGPFIMQSVPIRGDSCRKSRPICGWLSSFAAVFRLSAFCLGNCRKFPGNTIFCSVSWAAAGWSWRPSSSQLRDLRAILFRET